MKQHTKILNASDDFNKVVSFVKIKIRCRGGRPRPPSRPQGEQSTSEQTAAQERVRTPGPTSSSEAVEYIRPAGRRGRRPLQCTSYVSAPLPTLCVHTKQRPRSESAVGDAKCVVKFRDTDTKTSLFPIYDRMIRKERTKALFPSGPPT